MWKHPLPEEVIRLKWDDPLQEVKIEGLLRLDLELDYLEGKDQEKKHLLKDLQKVDLNSILLN